MLVLAGLFLGIVPACAAGLTLRRIDLARAGDAPAAAGAIVVLGAAVADGRPCPELAERLERALVLWRAGWAPRIVCSGGGPEATAMRNWLLARGVPASEVAMDPAGVSTAATVAGTARHAPVLFVTSPWHAHRVRAEARRRRVDARVCPARRSPVERGSWTRRRQLAREVAASWWYALGPARRPA